MFRRYGINSVQNEMLRTDENVRGRNAMDGRVLDRPGRDSGPFGELPRRSSYPTPGRSIAQSAPKWRADWRLEQLFLYPPTERPDDALGCPDRSDDEPADEEGRLFHGADWGDETFSSQSSATSGERPKSEGAQNPRGSKTT